VKRKKVSRETLTTVYKEQYACQRPKSTLAASSSLVGVNPATKVTQSASEDALKNRVALCTVRITSVNKKTKPPKEVNRTLVAFSGLAGVSQPSPCGFVILRLRPIGDLARFLTNMG
jgi:hypothetical protein